MNILDGQKIIRKKRAKQTYSIVETATKISQLGIVMSIMDAIKNQNTIKSRADLKKAFNSLDSMAQKAQRGENIDIKEEVDKSSGWLSKIGELVKDGVLYAVRTFFKYAIKGLFRAMMYIVVPAFSVMARFITNAAMLSARLTAGLLFNPYSLAVLGIAGLGYFIYNRYFAGPKQVELKDLELPKLPSTGGEPKLKTPSILGGIDRAPVRTQRESYSSALHESGLAEVISRKESGGNYNAANRTVGGLKNITGEYDLTKLTIDEIQKLQKEGKLFAVGRYQLIPGTLGDAVRELKISGDTKFDQKTQDRIFSEFLLNPKRADVYKYITGEVEDTSENRKRAGLTLAKIWRALADPRTGHTYGGSSDKMNKAFISWKEVEEFLIKARSLYTKKRREDANATDRSLISSGSEMFIPASGVVTSPFGSRFIFGKTQDHAGVDIAGPVGTPIYAAQAGTVISSGEAPGGYGNLVMIDHGSGITTLYAHASKVFVSKGDKVSRGQHIAAIGNTGISTGPHVHFEIRNGSQAIDPVVYIPKLGKKNEQVVAGDAVGFRDSGAAPRGVVSNSNSNAEIIVGRNGRLMEIRN